MLIFSVAHYALEVHFKYKRSGCGKVTKVTFELLSSGKRKNFGAYTQLLRETTYALARTWTYSEITSIFNSIEGRYNLLTWNCRSFHWEMLRLSGCGKVTKVTFELLSSGKRKNFGAYTQVLRETTYALARTWTYSEVSSIFNSIEGRYNLLTWNRAFHWELLRLLGISGTGLVDIARALSPGTHERGMFRRKHRCQCRRNRWLIVQWVKRVEVPFLGWSTFWLLFLPDEEILEENAGGAADNWIRGQIEALNFT
ncbi:hypothetical protein GPALN_005699 [Globodera pallida]|nr:hypothetical protein GPALN_005699 [Globodera pallida]